MKRIGIIGNSHLACWLMAYRAQEGAYARRADMRFFMMGGYGGKELEARDGCLTVAADNVRKEMEASSGGLSAINPGDFDHFLIVGMGFGYYNLLPTFGSFGTVRGVYQSPAISYVSQACLEESLRGVLANTVAVGVREKLAAITDKPVTFAPAPCRSEAVLKTRDADFADLCARGDQRHLYDLYCEQARVLARERRFDVVFQDAATMIAGGGYTKAEFSRGGFNSRMQQVGASDVSHMNADFGKIELDNALRFLGAG
jgi:hypothetical protein